MKNRAGAGRPRVLQQYEDELKVKIRTEERQHGHKLGPDDILLMWCEKLCEVSVKLHKEKKVLGDKPLAKVNARQLRKVEGDLKSMGYTKARFQVKSDLLQHLNRKVVSTQRRTTLSQNEEEVRCKLTWQDHDDTQHVCAFDLEELKKKAVGAEEWMKHPELTEQEFEDEVGVWVGLEGGKITVDEEEQVQDPGPQDPRTSGPQAPRTPGPLFASLQVTQIMA